MGALRTITVLLVAVGVVAPGCGGSPEADRRAWARSATVDLTEGVTLCASIGDEELRGECQSHIARRLAAGGDVPRARALCDEITVDMWRDECWFQIGDELELIGPPAVEVCTRAGTFRQKCLNHAINRHAVQKPERMEVGQEQALLRAVVAAVAAHYPQARERWQEHRAKRIFAGMIGSRWNAEGAVVDVADCGEAPTSLCIEAMQVPLFADVDPSRIAAACADRQGPLPVLNRRWTPGTELLVRQALARECAD